MDWRKFCVITATIAVVWCGFLLFTPPKADAVVSTNVACRDLWMHDHTVADEDRCRDKGWTVRARFILSPDRRMWTGVTRCDGVPDHGRGCFWNERTMGPSGLHYGSWVFLGNLGWFLHLTRINGVAA